LYYQGRKRTHSKTSPEFGTSHQWRNPPGTVDDDDDVFPPVEEILTRIDSQKEEEGIRVEESSAISPA